ncbi:MAG TPA: glycosyltransferase family 2 protein [Puia sp.]|nr:glycosyltransferase family 2 protein [Puia sp.]
MIFSVIIVNYRVRYFLELCLHSVGQALAGFEAEIIVVDNNSGDGSIEALGALFPQVRFIGNQENIGFGRANNQALREARGEYILFLNPDTILPEDFFRIGLDFLRGRPRAGGVGVRMIDGSGRFLPESRRGFPGPWVAFCKLSGLTALFPRSRFFAGYYLGYLPADRNHPAPVLSGACFLISRAILQETGGFDERFFMYAEDIDLSYRIGKAGYENYYLADTTIVHFKGESTSKDVRYVRQFYKAMSQFRQKHFTGVLPGLFNLAMELAIRVRAGIGGLGKLVERRRPAPTGVRRVWVIGDAEAADRVRILLSVSGLREIAAGPEQAEEMIFCEGRAFSFRECITALEAVALYRNGRQAKFHVAGSHLAVGSADRDGPGEILLF